MTEWIKGHPRELVAALRVPGEVYGQTGRLPKLLHLSKTDLIADIRKLPVYYDLTWKVGGDPTVTDRYARNRRHIIIYLGG